MIIKQFNGQLKRGMFLYQSLYNTGLGVIVNVSESCNQGDCNYLFNGVFASGGGEVHVVFFNGSESERMSEALIRSGNQYGIAREQHEAGLLANETQINQLLEKAQTARIAATNDKAAAEAQRAEEVEQNRNNPEYAHLKPEPRKYTGGTHVAVNVRKELKKHFPSVKFSVRSSYSRVDVSWTDGATEPQIKELLNKYQIGHLSGCGCYHDTTYSPFNDVFGGVDSLFLHREFSEALIEKGIAHIANEYNCNGITMTPEQYNKGSLYAIYPHDFADSRNYGEDLQTLLRQYLFTLSAYIAPKTKASRASVAKLKASSVLVPSTDVITCEHTALLNEVVEAVHTRKGFPIYVVSLASRESIDVFNALLETAKSCKGWYNSFTRDGAIAGFTFKDKAKALAFYQACHAA
ncbi:hypothetical protein QTV44_002475 [Vibrio vulnificus]|nr:hypothetical protein [Vibrio vulnificus]